MTQTTGCWLTFYEVQQRHDRGVVRSLAAILLQIYCLRLPTFPVNTAREHGYSVYPTLSLMLVAPLLRPDRPQLSSRCLTFNKCE